jgi:hypothetical protein
LKIQRVFPVAEMKGVNAGASDVHYGNNVSFIPDHTYKITVVLNGERAVFRIKASPA